MYVILKCSHCQLKDIEQSKTSTLCYFVFTYIILILYFVLIKSEILRIFPSFKLRIEVINSIIPDKQFIIFLYEAFFAIAI